MYTENTLFGTVFGVCTHVSTRPTDDTRVGSLHKIDCIQSECRSGGSRVDEDMVCRCTGDVCRALVLLSYVFAKILSYVYFGRNSLCG